MPLLESAPLGAAIKTGDINARVQAYMNDHNSRSRRALLPYEARQMVEGEDNCFYIYNVSHIHAWSKQQGQLGTIVIQKAPPNMKYSEPATIKGALLRWVTGLGLDQPFIEGGEEIVQDILGNGPMYDARGPNSDLTKYGVFCSQKPFDAKHLPASRLQKLKGLTGAAAAQFKEEFVSSASEKSEMLSEATSRLLVALQERIQEADNYHMGDPEQRKYVQQTDWFRLCLKEFNYLTGKKETRPWAAISIDEALTSCRFCGHQQKPGLPKCANCKEILNQALYDEMKLESETEPSTKKA